MNPFSINLTQLEGAAIVNALNQSKATADSIIKTIDSSFLSANPQAVKTEDDKPKT